MFTLKVLEDSKKNDAKRYGTNIGILNLFFVFFFTHGNCQFTIGLIFCCVTTLRNFTLFSRYMKIGVQNYKSDISKTEQDSGFL